ncbi:uncharacterized protein LOC112087493 [Eutrema salsugineum]|uniref:uncharacterized protein LOC112087493 n=1 Tax=Eutrema salsugineum TaxID=72664 RepID=UPI000CED6241|nr:uncharacterized protein LOC112087493 [Eutrema salsugineum]
MDGITLTQKRYALKILEEAGMESCNSTQTPMEVGLQLSKAEGEKEIDANSPRESHGAAMKHCLRYLRGTTTLGLVFEYSASNIPRLIGYSDSSHNVDLDDGKSTTGMYSILVKVQSPGVRRSKTMWHCHFVKLSLWRILKQQGRIQSFMAEVNIFIEDITSLENVLKMNKLKCNMFPETEQRADILIKALGKIKFKEKRDLIGVQDLEFDDFKFKEERVD